MEKRLLDRLLLFFIISLLVIDTGYTFFQHVGKELDGDLVAIVTYAEQYDGLQNDPFGWKVLTENASYGGVNRYFVHWYISTYFKTVPFFLQQFVSPIDSLYIASGISKTLIHLMLIVLLAMMISGTKTIRNKRFWYAALILVPLFQSGGHFYKYFSFVDQSFTYSSFYALPMALFLLFFKPYHDVLIHQRKSMSLWMKGMLLVLIVVLPFSGPLIPGIVLVIAALFLSNVFQDYWKGREIYLFDQTSTFLRYAFYALVVLSLYSIYLGQFNAENETTSLSLIERYVRLPIGLYYLFTQKLAYPILFLLLGINIYLLKKQNTAAPQFFRVFQWLSLFTLLYLLLLPLGGFRGYRPNIIRKDTFLPIALCLTYLYAYSTYCLFQHGVFKYRKAYAMVIGLFSLIFLYADEPGLERYECQRSSLEDLSKSSKELTLLRSDCTILTWYPVKHPEESPRISKMLKYWNVLDEEKRFYQPEYSVK